MMRILQIFGILLLLITSIGALAAGYSLIVDPSGQGIQLPLEYLDHSPFSNFLIPGITLFTVIGLFGLIVLVTSIARMKNYNLLQMGYGVLLTGWIIIQVIMLQFTYYLHFVFGFIGVYMIVLGLMNRSKKRSTKKSDSLPRSKYFQTLQ